MGILLLILLQNFLFGLYTSWRIYTSFWSDSNAFILIPIIFLINNIFLIVRILQKNFNITSPDWLSYFAHILFGYTIYLSLFFAISDIVKLVLHFTGLPLFPNVYQGIFATVGGLIVFTYGFINGHITRIKIYNITLNKKINKPFSIVAMTDLHIGADMTPRRLSKEVALINKLNPDLVLIGGDLVDHSTSDFKTGHINAFKKLHPKIDSYAVLGNHEYYSGTAEENTEKFTQANLKVLKDEVAYINDLDLYIIGRDSLRHTHSNGNEREPIDFFIPKIEDLNKPIIILDHVPKGLEDGKKINADIQISGHTHDGQFFPINLVTKMLFKLSTGMINDNGFFYFVSSGLGLWGPPMRVGTHSEILFIRVHGKA